MFDEGTSDHLMGERTDFQYMVLEKLVIHMQKKKKRIGTITLIHAQKSQKLK